MQKNKIGDLEISQQESNVDDGDEEDSLTNHKGQIGFLGGLSIAVNSIVGPAMLNLPATYQKSGFIPTTTVIILVCLLSIMCCLNMSNVISKLPGNANFRKEIEYSESFRIFWGYNWFVFTQVSFFCCLMCQCIASIIDTAQVVDVILSKMFGYAYALRLSYSPFGVDVVSWNETMCPPLHEGLCEPFTSERGLHGLLLSTGYVICTIVFLPIALLNLKENTPWQIFCFVVTIVVFLQFSIYFLFVADDGHIGIDDLQSRLSLWGDSYNELFGIILFDYTLCTAIPAWLYEKSPTVNVAKTIEVSSVLSSVMYIIVGTLGALAMPYVSQNMLSSMMTGQYGIVMAIGTSFFAFVIIGFGVPLFCVLMRLNLTGSNLCSTFTANLIAVYTTFGISWMFYGGEAIEKLLAWGGLLFTSVCSFLAPLLLAFHVTYEFASSSSATSRIDELEAPIPPSGRGGQATTMTVLKGSIPVWFGYKLSRKAELIGLGILFVFALLAVAISIYGSFQDSDDTDDDDDL